MAQNPKAGEWWKVYTTCEMVLYFDGADWATSDDAKRGEIWVDVKPLYRMKKSGE